MELSWAVSHVKVEHISNVLEMLQTQFVTVEKVTVSKQQCIFLDTDDCPRSLHYIYAT
jgi:hypothetical protein